MGCITRFVLALLNLIIPITDWDIKLPAVATTSVSTIFNLFVINTGWDDGWSPEPTIHASVMRVDVRRSQTEYWITCTPPFGFDPPTAPCNYIHGASVTVNPTGMELDIRRASDLFSGGYTTINGTEVWTMEATYINVRGAATCDIHGSTSAFCTGQMTSDVWMITSVMTDSNITWGHMSIVDVEGIWNRFTDVKAHSVPATITAGFDNIPTTTTTTTTTASWNDGGARVTGQAYAMVAGAIALAGGVALM